MHGDGLTISNNYNNIGDLGSSSITPISSTSSTSEHTSVRTSNTFVLHASSSPLDIFMISNSSPNPPDYPVVITEYPQRQDTSRLGLSPIAINDNYVGGGAYVTATTTSAVAAGTSATLPNTIPSLLSSNIDVVTNYNNQKLITNNLSADDLTQKQQHENLDIDGKTINDNLMINSVRSIDAGEVNTINYDSLLVNDGPSIITYDRDEEPLDIVKLPEDPDTKDNEKLMYNHSDEDDITIHKMVDDFVEPKYIYNAIPLTTPGVPHYVMHDATTQKFKMLHNESTEENDETLEKPRILVNISIATDTGAGTQNHAVYMLHVSVPASSDFFAQPKASATDENSNEFDNGPPKPPPAPPCPCQCASHENLAELPVRAGNAVTEATTVTPSTTNPDIDTNPHLNTFTDNYLAPLDSDSDSPNTTQIVMKSCPEVPILILEGEGILIRNSQ